MRRNAADVLGVVALAATLIAAVAAPVLRAPSARVFGMEIVGRHHDPFTVMQQFERPLTIGIYTQPLTDMTGALLARLAGPIAAYNWLVLITFPLSAAAAYLLARYLTLSAAGAAVAALAYAFAPFHLAQSAYHPHIAQTQWMPLYLLALWRCLDKATPGAVSFLVGATLTVTLSNFYGGLIAAVVTPAAIAASWLVTRRSGPSATRSLIITSATLALVAAGGIAYASHAVRAVVTNPAAFAFPRADLFRYSAKWWAYLVPPVEHPWLGAMARRIWDRAGVREGLLEQQVSLGWAIVALGLVAILRWLRRDRGDAALARVPVLVVVAVVALLCSLSPERTIGTITFVRPSALLYNIVPMFRSYARFGLVVQLMAALLAGIGVDALRRSGTTWTRVACMALLVMAAGEYAVSPAALWRDVLPTRAHRWVMQQTSPVRVLDCARVDQESASVPWLTRSRVTLLDSSIGDCTEPNLPGKLAADGYTHLLVRSASVEGRAFFDRPAPDGLCLVARFRDAQIFAVTAPASVIYTAAMTQFSPREHDVDRSWRWMGSDASWTVVNTGTRPVVASLAIELSAAHQTRRLELRLDGGAPQTLTVEQSRQVYELGPLTIPPGNHQLVFHPLEAPLPVRDATGTRDPRLLSFALGTWSWTVRGAHS
jgi:hypothetical protein